MSPELLQLCNQPISPLFWDNVRWEVPSGWHAHVPFAHWLIANLQPATLVELGTHHGVSYAAFCEAVSKCKLTTRCYAIDHWQGDEHAGHFGDEVYDEFRRFHDPRYGTFSELIRNSFENAVPYFQDGSIDLLHIDGLHRYDAVKNDFFQWFPKLSTSAVVLFHDTNVHQREFGVSRFWHELCETYSGFEFLHGYGLGVLAVGSAVRSPISDLCSLTDLSTINAIRQRFAEPGDHQAQHNNALIDNVRQRDEARHAAQHTAAEAHKIAERLAATQFRMEQTVNRLAELEYDLWQARTLLGERDRLVAHLQWSVEALLKSTSWRVTSPLRIATQLTRVNYGRLKRLKDAFSHREPKDRAALLGLFHPDHLRAAISAVVGSGSDAGSTLRSLQRRVVDAFNDPARSIPLRPPDPGNNYATWIARFDELTERDKSAIRRNISTFNLPSITIVLHFSAGTQYFAATTIARLSQQLYDRWRAIVCVNDDCASSTVESIRALVAGDHRFSVICLPIDDDGRRQLDAKKSDEIILVCAGGVLLRDHALYCFAAAAMTYPNAQIFYSDEDKYNGSVRHDPFFKPQFSPELLKGKQYLGPCVLLRMRDPHFLIENIEDIDRGTFVARLALEPGYGAVNHIPLVLYHDVLDARVAFSINEVTADIAEDSLPFVSIIIPSRDQYEFLKQCLQDIQQRTSYPKERLEVIVIDNGTTAPEALDLLSAYANRGQIRVLRDDRPFNYSRLNNEAVTVSRGDVLVFINNDTSVNDANWLRRLVAFAVRPEIAAVGCKLLYPDGTVQHGGIVCGINGGPGHVLAGIDKADGGYQNIANLTREVSAVTGACLAIRKQVFDELGCFDPALGVAFNDVLLCVKAVEFGYLNIIVAEPLMTHFESKTRGLDDTPEKVSIRVKELRYFQLRSNILRDDPWYNLNLSLSLPYQLAFPPRRAKPWRLQALQSGERLRVLMLSCNHNVGSGVAAVLRQQVIHLLRAGYEVYVGGPRGEQEVDYRRCRRVLLDDPQSAAIFAVEHDIDCVVAHTPPFFSIVKLLGAWPKSIIYDYGEPNPEFFPDSVVARGEVIAEKSTCYALADRVFAISRSVQTEISFARTSVIRLGNDHMGIWDAHARSRRDVLRCAFGVAGQLLVLNVCRFFEAERNYKGVDSYAEIRDELFCRRGDLRDRVQFVLAGRAGNDDARKMEDKGLRVLHNIEESKMIELYIASDIYISMSKWEGYNLGIGQALAFGLPVIASDIPAHREFGVRTSNNIDEIVTHLEQLCDRLLHQNVDFERAPHVFSWSEPLAEFAAAISDVCAEQT